MYYLTCSTADLITSGEGDIIPHDSQTDLVTLLTGMIR